MARLLPLRRRFPGLLLACLFGGLVGRADALCQPVAPRYPFTDDPRLTAIAWGRGKAPRFVGEVAVRWDGDGRNMTLIEAFGFIDALDRKWFAPKGFHTDGASIPTALWSSGYAPYVGKYRRAAVIHDFYCAIENRTAVSAFYSSDTVHRAFYEAMVTDGVPKWKAGVLLAGVLWGGPQWKRAGAQVGFDEQRPSAITDRQPLTQKEVAELEGWVKASNPSAAQIEAYVASRMRR